MLCLAWIVDVHVALSGSVVHLCLQTCSLRLGVLLEHRHVGLLLPSFQVHARARVMFSCGGDSHSRPWSKQTNHQPQQNHQSDVSQSKQNNHQSDVSQPVSQSGSVSLKSDHTTQSTEPCLKSDNTTHRAQSHKEHSQTRNFCFPFASRHVVV